MVDLKEKSDISQNDEKRKNVIIGVITLAVILLLLLLVMKLRSNQESVEMANYQLAIASLKDFIFDKESDCRFNFEKSREGIRNNIGRVKAAKGLINSKAIAYDILLKEAQGLCEKGEKAIKPDDALCDSLEVCSEKARAFLLAGDFDSGIECAKSGLAIKNNSGLRELYNLMVQMQIE